MSPFFLFVYLILGGILGGLLSTIASMASLATYPILLSVGIPPVYANTTNEHVRATFSQINAFNHRMF